MSNTVAYMVDYGVALYVLSTYFLFEGCYSSAGKIDVVTVCIYGGTYSIYAIPLTYQRPVGTNVKEIFSSYVFRGRVEF